MGLPRLRMGVRTAIVQNEEIMLFKGGRSRLKNLSSVHGDTLSYLKQLNENVFIEAVPEVHIVPLESLSMSTVDCVLISNWNSLVALPFYVENSGFRGVVYATEPVVQFGRLMMLELIEYFERIVLGDVNNMWKDPTIYSTFPNTINRNPLEWKPFYSKQTMEQALVRVTTVSFNQTVELEGSVSVVACPSGYSIGSSNWVFKTEYERIGYLASSSVRSTHARPVEWEKLQDADALIMTSLSRTPDFSSEGTVVEVAQTIVDTLKRGGNVLMPVNPVGTIYDLIDVVSRSIDNAGGATLEARIYFISPVAKGALAYSNVNAEWLAEARQSAVYVPEEPFCHAALVRNGRLKLYDNIYESFCREYKTPCVVLTGHPSLRIGDAPHLLEMWGNDSKNALIMTDPDYPLNEVYAPYEDLAIRAFYYPIETRLEFSQVNTALLPVELKPKNLIIPEAYSLSHNSKSPTHNRIEFVVQYNSITPVKYDEQLSISLPSKKMRKRKIKISPDVIKRIELRGHYANPEIGISSLTGFLCAFDGVYELLPAKKKVGALRPKYAGQLSTDIILKALQKRNLSGRVINHPDGERKIVRIDSINSAITLDAEGMSTNIQSPKEHRMMLLDAVTSYLQILC
ncbi:Integrator complex subunit 9 [Trichostrongylus colubriformis]|uniref:Integrator complex subunit 9 n=1 Tax=Trichostrongylus colubriformis TaxID=6319 RepID=A0AAN8FET1_TRICO